MTQCRVPLAPSRRRDGIWAVAVAVGFLHGFGIDANAQQPRMLNPDTTRRQSPRMPSMMNRNVGTRYDIVRPQERRMRDYSWTHIDAPRARQIMVHDIISIVVDEKSEVTLNSNFNRQRTSNLKAEIKEFMRFGKKGNLATAAPNQPSIDVNLQGRTTNSGRASDQEGVRYRIAATVVDVLPNGIIVLEARKSLRTSRDSWQISLTGLIRSQDIRRDNTALSENIANLDSVIKRGGKVYDSTKRPWGVRLYDLLSPF